MPHYLQPRDNDSPASERRRCWAGCGLLLLVIVLSAAGCSRSYWRKHADREVYRLLPGKMQSPQWGLPRIDITPDPASRLFDPYPLDKGPLPPDDPAAHEYMRRVNGIRQSRSWHKFGTALSIENPHWLEPFGLKPTEDGDRSVPLEQEAEGVVPPLPAEAAAPADESPIQTVSFDESIGESPEDEVAACRPVRPTVSDGFGIENLTLPQALELSTIHSREYQTQIENLYLTALGLTFERFRFQVRYLGQGGGEPSADLTFESIPRVENSLTSNKRFGISQLLPAGGQWIVELANNTVWLFAGPDQTNTATTLSYSLVQPLLLGAGRKVVLESLTQAERDTLYSARDLARFRKTFFADVVVNGPSGGFLGILQQTQVVENRQNNIRQLEQQLESLRVDASRRPEEITARLPMLPEGLEIPPALAGDLRHNAETGLLYWRGDMTPEQERLLIGLSDAPSFRIAVNELIGRLRTEAVTLDVLQLETRLADARNALRDAQRQVLDSLDLFKIQLGLPPDFLLSIDDSLLDQFRLIDPQFFRFEQQVEEFGEVLAALDEDDPSVAGLRSAAGELRQLRKEIREEGLPQIETDRGRLERHMAERLARLETDEERYAVRDNVERDRRLYGQLLDDYAEIGRRLDALRKRLSQSGLPQAVRKDAASELAVLRDDLLKFVQGIRVIQAGLRVELIELQPFELAQQESVAVGLVERLDLKNARAEAMDARRREEVAANRLEAVLDLVAEGDIRTRPLGRNRGENPFDFRGRESSFRVGARFTAPLDQIAERNDYRAALIEYQRARRDYMALEDQVKLSIRQSWRQLRLLEENFETSRQALRLAATQLDAVVEEANRRQDQPQSSGQRGLNLLNALNELLTAQNRLIGIWVDYERSRINIYRDMGMMEINPRGVWTDEFYQQSPPSNLTEPDDPQQQLEEQPVSADDGSRGRVFVRRGASGDGTAGFARSGGRVPVRGSVRAAGGAALPPRPSRGEGVSAGGPAAGDGWRSRVLDHSGGVRPGGRVQRSGD